MRRSRSTVYGFAAGLAIIAAVLLFLLQQQGATGSVAGRPPVQDQPRPTVQRGADQEDAVKRSERRATTSGVLEVDVRERGRDAAPIPGAAAYWIERNAAVFLEALGNQQAVAHSDAAGLCRIDASRVTHEKDLAIVCGGYVPCVLSNPRVGTRHRAILAREHRLKARVVTGDGSPVPGVMLIVCHGSIPVKILRDRLSVRRLMLRRRSAGGLLRKAITDDSGRCIVQHLAEGAYNVLLSTGDSFYFVRRHSGFEKGDRVTIPCSEKTFVVEEVVAAVATCTGDDIILARPKWRSPAVSKIADPPDLFATDAVKRAEAALRKRFPGAFVQAGVRRLAWKRMADGRMFEEECSWEVLVFGRTSGWHRARIVARPVSQIVAPISITVPTGPHSRTAHVTVRVLDAKGREVSLRNKEAALFWESPLGTVSLPVDTGRMTEVPSGVCQLGLKPMFHVKDEDKFKKYLLGDGASTEIAVALDHPVYRCRLRFRLCDGSVPDMVCLLYESTRDNGMKQQSGGDIPFWLPGGRLHYSASIGCSPWQSGDVVLDDNKGPNDLQEFVIASREKEQ